MSPCAASLFYFFTSYSHIRILSLRTPLIRFFKCRLVRIHCFTFSHHIPTFEFFLLGPRSLDFSNVALCGFIVLLFLQHILTFEFFLLGPRSLDFSNVALCGFIVLLFLQHIPTFEFFLLGPPLTRFFKCRLVRIHCSTFFTSYSHIRILSLRTPLISFFKCRLVRIHCFTFSHRIPTIEFFLLGPRSLDFSNVALCGFIVLLFHIVFPNSNSFS